jgi:hypothetical protein
VDNGGDAEAHLGDFFGEFRVYGAGFGAEVDFGGLGYASFLHCVVFCGRGFIGLVAGTSGGHGFVCRFSVELDRLGQFWGGLLRMVKLIWRITRGAVWNGVVRAI